MKYLLTLLQVIGILTSGLHGNAVTESSEATAVAAATTDDTLTPVALSIDVTTTVVTLYIDPEDTAATETPADTAEPAAESAPEPPEPTAAPSAIATKPDDFIDMDECAKCICWSWSSCDARFCDSSTQLCNMYHIEYVAWRASGAPSIPDREFPNPVSAFEHCRSNTTCAIKTISQYFELHKADCNQDGVIDCVDVTIIHTVGPSICKAPPKHMIVVGIAECMAAAKEHADAISAGLDPPPRRRPTQQPKVHVPITMQP